MVPEHGNGSRVTPHIGKGNLVRKKGTQQMAEMDYRREIDEAMCAGQEALRCLNQAKDCLNSAGNWGIVDMLGGGMLTTFIKRSKMKDADALVQQARSALKRFQRELMDVDSIPEFHIQTGDFLSFADYFFDGFVADMLVQSKINDARRQVENAIQKVNYIMSQLKAL